MLGISIIGWIVIGIITVALSVCFTEICVGVTEWMYDE